MQASQTGSLKRSIPSAAGTASTGRETKTLCVCCIPSLTQMSEATRARLFAWKWTTFAAMEKGENRIKNTLDIPDKPTYMDCWRFIAPLIPVNTDSTMDIYVMVLHALKEAEKKRIAEKKGETENG